MKQHHYTLGLEWTGNTGEGTRSYQSYKRDHRIVVNGKPDIQASSDPVFRGDPERYTPEELLLASISGCHMLWFLHLCAVNDIVVTAYTDSPAGIMEESSSGSGRFTEVTLFPKVSTQPPADPESLKSLHEEAHKLCFIANSLNFPVRIL